LAAAVKQEPAAAIKAEPGGAVKADPDGQQQQQHRAGPAAVKQEQHMSRDNSDMNLGIAADQEGNVGTHFNRRTCCMLVVAVV
jgi:hypothetical protein